MSHKHCIFCGLSDDNSDYACHGQNNPLQRDTVGNKPHAYPVSIQEKAKAAYERAKANFRPEDVTFISTPAEDEK